MAEILKLMEAYLQHGVKKQLSGEYNQLICRKQKDVFLSITDQVLPVENKNKTCVVTTGYSASGKTTFANELKKIVPNVVVLDSEDIHKKIRDNLHLNGVVGVNSKNDFWLGQFITNDIRIGLITQLCENNYQIVNSSVNLTKCERRKKINKLKKNGYKTILVWVKTSEQELYKRLTMRDERNKGYKMKNSWVDIFHFSFL